MTTETTQAIEAVTPLSEDIAALNDTVDGYVIHTDDDLGQLGDLVKILKQKKKALAEKEREFTKPLVDLTKKLRDVFRAPKQQVDTVLNAAQAKMNDYVRLQEEIRAAEEAEAKAKAEAEAAAAEKAANELREQGNDELADKLEDAVDTNVVPMEKAPARGNVATTSARKRWTATVTDPAAFLRAIADGKYPLDVVDFRQVELNKIARDAGEAGEHDGLKIEQEITAGVR